MISDTSFPNAFTQTVIIPANSSVNINVKGSTLAVLSSTGSFKASPNDGTSSFVMSQGLSYKCPAGVEFDMITLRNDSGVSITTEIFAGSGEIVDARLVLTSGTNIEVDNVAGDTLDVVPLGGKNATYGTVSVADTATLIFAADNTGTGWLLHNKGTDVICLGTTSGVTLSNGLPLYAGEKLSWDSRTALYGISPVAGQDLRYFKGAQ